MKTSVLVEILIDVDIPAANFEEAVEEAEKVVYKDLVKVKQGEAIDWAVTVVGINHNWPTLGEHGE